jgi:hypothetical protein
MGVGSWKHRSLRDGDLRGGGGWIARFRPNTDHHRHAQASAGPGHALSLCLSRRSADAIAGFRPAGQNAIVTWFRVIGGYRLMRTMLATLLTVALATSASAQSDVPRVGGAEFSGFKTYWAQKRESCQPMISFKIKNTSSGAIGPIRVHMEVVDKDSGSIFAGGLALLQATELPPGNAKEVVIGGDHEIAPHDCLGDMHETAFATVHFVVRLTATAGQDPASVEILRDEAMKDEVVPAQD